VRTCLNQVLCSTQVRYLLLGEIILAHEREYNENMVSSHIRFHSSEKESRSDETHFLPSEEESYSSENGVNFEVLLGSISLKRGGAPSTNYFFMSSSPFKELESPPHSFASSPPSPSVETLTMSSAHHRTSSHPSCFLLKSFILFLLHSLSTIVGVNCSSKK